MTSVLFSLLRLVAFPLCCTFLAGQVPSIKEIVERFDAAQAKADTLQAPFTLSIKRAMLQAPSIIKGMFYLSGSDCAHFAFSPSEDMVIHVTDRAFVSYSPLKKKGEMVKTGISKSINRKSLGLGYQLSSFSDYFKMEVSESKDAPGVLEVTLTPRSISFKKKIEKIQVWIDRNTYLPKGLTWIEKGGDTWLLELGALQVNRAIPASIINFAVPAGTPMQSEFSFFSAKKSGH